MWKAPTFRSSPEPLPHAPLQLPTAKPPLPGLLPLLPPEHGVVQLVQRAAPCCRILIGGGEQIPHGGTTSVALQLGQIALDRPPRAATRMEHARQDPQKP